MEYLPMLQALVLPALGLLWWEVRTMRADIKELHKRITNSNKEHTAANENTQKHILACKNFQLRDGSEGLLK